MASSVLTSRTIRGISYSQGDSFICASAASGNAGSEGNSNSAAALTVGNKYYFLGYAVADDSGTTIKFPCKIGSSSSTSSTIGWYPESVFPYATYKITFNANGGSGAPSAQTKTHGTALTLSSTKPTRSGYTFVGWGTSASDTSKDYDAGDSYTANASDTLYAIWKKTITLTYNANGGSGAPSSQSVTIYNSTTSNKFTLSSTEPTRTGYTFLGWSTSSTATSSSYAAGGSITLSDSDTLYAVWDANSYTYNIVYKSSSGVQLGTATVAKDYGTTNTVSPKAFTGYTSPSSQSVKWDSTSAKTITFTYTPTSYNVTINCNGGSGVNSRTYNIETATFNLGAPTRTGHTFRGWTGSNGDTAQKTVSIAKGSTGNKTYTAQWDEHKLTVNYYSNKADYGTFQGNSLNVSSNTNILIHSQDFLYDNKYDNGLSDVQNKDYLYLSRTGYKSTGYWGTLENGGTLINQPTSFATGQDLAIALGTSIANGNMSVNIYPQWTPSGVVYIDNGIKLEPYLIYIDNGTNWDLYLAYIDEGTDWKIIS